MHTLDDLVFLNQIDESFCELKTVAISARPIGAPGCPEFAFCTISAAKNRMVFAILPVIVVSTYLSFVSVKVLF